MGYDDHGSYNSYDLQISVNAATRAISVLDQQRSFTYAEWAVDRKLRKQ
jgi:hypothetical protein